MTMQDVVRIARQDARNNTSRSGMIPAQRWEQLSEIEMDVYLDIFEEVLDELSMRGR